ncbi:inorganic phosphate transporter [Hymenopellis radicata]|nr:inorganic phosphate transporter [Hymenopellis radicata]
MASVESASLTSPHPHGGYVLGERRRAALAEVDNAKLSWFHVKVCLVAGVGFFTDAYDIFAINIASVMLGYVYGGDDHKLSVNQDLGVKVATPVGTLLGQLLFGWLADVVGRKRMYGVELMIIILGCFAQSISAMGHAVNIFGVLIVWRFIMGIGIGGDYPTSSGWGNFTAALVGLIVVVCYKTSILGDTPPFYEHVDEVWRILIGLGCVPGVYSAVLPVDDPGDAAAAQDIERVMTNGNADRDPDAVVQKVDAPKAGWRDFSRHFSELENFKVLFGAAYSWFALDIAFYGLGLNSSIVLQAIGFGNAITAGSQGVYDNLHNICVGNLILAVGGLIPGYWVAFLFIDSWGRKPIQLMGFILLTILFVIMGFGYEKMNETKSGQKAFVFLYCLANFFQNFGPNTTTFIIPGEVFPTRYRSTAHGICAASGKLGAIIAQVGFARMRNIGGTDNFVKHILEIFALFMLTGIFSTLLVPETKNKTLEELSNEDQEHFLREPRSEKKASP